MPTPRQSAQALCWNHAKYGDWLIAGAWSTRGLAQVRLLRPLSPEAIAVTQLQPCRASEKTWHKAIDRFFASGDFGIPWDELDPTAWTPFQTAIRRACFHIQPGSQWTYQQLATHAGYPKAARAAGRAMATNPIPLVIPCHRVVGAKGALTGYSGGDGIPTKRWLLDHEQRIVPARLA
ncbi:MAG: methylated-DNA--[protein]-cysteine S-methyltransferase [Pirellulaceae bacterium]